MLKLLIVDDERIILNGLRSIIEKKLKLSFPVDICTASNAIEALDILKVFSPDLILTDIRMPVMDGFEFLEKVRKLEGLNCDIAILTSHADFEYARTAISFHVEEFLLKPIETGELEKILQKVFAKKEKARNEEEQEALIEIRNLLLYDLPGDQAEDEIINSIFPNKYFTVVLIEPDYIEENMAGRLEYEISYYYPVCKIFYFYQKKHYIAVCNHDQFFVNTEALKLNIRKLLDDRGSFSISISCNDWRELHSLYMNAQRRILYDKIYRDNMELADISFVTWQDCINILSGGWENFDENVRKYFDRTLTQFPDSSYTNRQIADSFIQNCNLWLDSMGALPMENTLAKADIPDRAALYNVIRKTVEIYGKNQNKKETCLSEPISVSNMRSYIASHYMEDLSLEKIADAMDMHPNYVCNLFKKYVGKSYLVFLQEIRIEAVKKLIASPENLQLEEIAERAGFHGPGQLIRVFKKYEKMTPGEYKRMYE